MDLKNFTSAIMQIAEEKGISKEKVIETIESAIAAAYKKEYGEKGQIIRAKIELETGKVVFWHVMQVLDQSMIYSEKELEDLKNQKMEHVEGKIRFNSEKHVMLKDAKKLKVAGDVNAVPPLGIEGVELMDFGTPLIHATDSDGAVGVGALSVGNIKYKLQNNLLKLLLETEEPVYLDFRVAFSKARSILQ